jgi:quercetin dioxygenase-like cupin family protein
MTRIRITLIAAAALSVTGAAFAQQATAPTATRVALAQVADPAGARGQTLGLSRVTIPPQARLALHIHPGTQTAYIEKGTLTYSVKKGTVPVYRGAADQHPKLVRRITSGQTAKIRAGQWLVEKPGVQHFAANLGDGQIVILVATLLEDGKPPAIPVGQATG